MQQLKSGRKLDALIAEKVMKLPKVRYSSGDPNDISVFGRLEQAWYESDYPDSFGFPSGNIPHYSTDISDAWKIVEKFNKPGQYIEIGNCEDGCYWCEIFGEGLIATLPSAETAPLAICTAALITLGINDESL